MTGFVQPEGIDLDLYPAEPGSSMGSDEADVYEMPVAAHAIRRTKSDTHVGIAVITKRTFFQQLIITRRDSPIHSIQDLRGTRLAQMGWYQHAIGVWLRGHLRERYGIEPTEIRWVTERPSLYNLDDAAEASITILPEGRTPLQLLLYGEVDALIHEASHQFLGHHPELRRVLTNYKDEEAAYFRDTGCFPVNHSLVIRREIIEQNPWVAGSLVRAFDAAQKLAIRGMERNNATVSTPWMDGLLEEATALGGGDLYPNGLERTGPQIERFIRYLHEQRLLPRRFAVEELFADDRTGAANPA